MLFRVLKPELETNIVIALLRWSFQCTRAQSLEASEFPSVCEGASSLEESSVLSEEEGGTLIWQ